MHFRFLLVSQPDSIWGLSNCNDFSGHYTLKENQLSDTLFTESLGCPLTEEFENALENATIQASDSASLQMQSTDQTMTELWFKRAN